MSRKGGTVGGRWVNLKVANSMDVSGLSFEKTLVGTGWAISVLLCINGLRKQSSHLVGPPFLTVKLFSQSGVAVAGQEL